LPGFVSQGRTRQEAITNIREAIQGYILALQEDNLPLPGVVWTHCFGDRARKADRIIVGLTILRAGTR